MANKTNSSVFPFLPILALIFITLKLTGVITWSWVMVLAPLWIPFALVAIVLLLVLLAATVVVAFKPRRY